MGTLTRIRFFILSPATRGNGRNRLRASGDADCSKRASRFLGFDASSWGSRGTEQNCCLRVAASAPNARSFTLFAGFSAFVFREGQHLSFCCRLPRFHPFHGQAPVRQWAHLPYSTCNALPLSAALGAFWQRHRQKDLAVQFTACENLAPLFCSNTSNGKHQLGG